MCERDEWFTCVHCVQLLSVVMIECVYVDEMVEYCVCVVDGDSVCVCACVCVHVCACVCVIV